MKNQNDPVKGCNFSFLDKNEPPFLKLGKPLNRDDFNKPPKDLISLDLDDGVVFDEKSIPEFTEFVYQGLVSLKIENLCFEMNRSYLFTL